MDNKKIKAIIFDLDGVIVDSEPLHFEAAKFALKEYGINLMLEEYLQFGVAKGAKNLYEKISEKYGIIIDMERAFKIKKDKFQELFEVNVSPRKGIIEAIESLGEKYILAIASSGIRESVISVLERLNIKDKFSLIVTAEDVARVKPFPDIYEKSCDLLGLDKTECVAIEDSETGVESAKEAGIKCIAIPCEFTKHQNFSKADVVLDSLDKLNVDFI